MTNTFTEVDFQTTDIGSENNHSIETVDKTRKVERTYCTKYEKKTDWTPWIMIISIGGLLIGR